MNDRGFCSTPKELAEDLARRLVQRGFGASPGILDPACGDGALLEAAWEIGRPLGLSAERLFGFEIDPELAELTRARLRRQIGGADGEVVARNVITTDSLRDDLAWPGATHIIANPPWVSFSGRQSRGMPGRMKDRGGGWPSLHGTFLERIALHVAAEKTAAGVLLPASVCDGYRSVR